MITCACCGVEIPGLPIIHDGYYYCCRACTEAGPLAVEQRAKGRRPPRFQAPTPDHPNQEAEPHAAS